MKFLTLIVWLKKQILTQKLVNLKIKLTDHKHGKYITTPEFNEITAEIFAARLAQVNLITKTDFDAKMSSLNKGITLNKTRQLLVENELKKIKVRLVKLKFRLFYWEKSF